MGEGKGTKDKNTKYWLVDLANVAEDDELVWRLIWSWSLEAATAATASVTRRRQMPQKSVEGAANEPQTGYTLAGTRQLSIFRETRGL